MSVGGCDEAVVDGCGLSVLGRGGLTVVGVCDIKVVVDGLGLIVVCGGLSVGGFVCDVVGLLGLSVVGGCSVLVAWDLYVVSESAWSVVGCCGSAVVSVKVVTGSFDVVDAWCCVVE